MTTAARKFKVGDLLRIKPNHPDNYNKLMSTPQRLSRIGNESDYCYHFNSVGRRFRESDLELAEPKVEDGKIVFGGEPI